MGDKEAITQTYRPTSSSSSSSAAAAAAPLSKKDKRLQSHPPPPISILRYFSPISNTHLSYVISYTMYMPVPAAARSKA